MAERRALPRYQIEEMKKFNILFPRVGIEHTASRVYAWFRATTGIYIYSRITFITYIKENYIIKNLYEKNLRIFSNVQTLHLHFYAVSV